MVVEKEGFVEFSLCYRLVIIVKKHRLRNISLRARSTRGMFIEILFKNIKQNVISIHILWLMGNFT